MARDPIETLIEAGKWEKAQAVIAKELGKEPEDHWLWARLSGVKYEQRDYKEALDAAERALQVVPDCPLALWSYAGALEMLGKAPEACKVYLRLLRRGIQQLTRPDEDAEECWEGRDWTRGLMVDCIFRSAGCLAQMSKRSRKVPQYRQKAVEMYRHFLDLADYGMQGIYSRDEAVEQLKKLVPGKKAIPNTMDRAKRELEDVLEYAETV